MVYAIMDVDSLIWWDRRRGGQSLAHWGGMDIAEGINSPFSSGRKKNEGEENDMLFVWWN